MKTICKGCHILIVLLLALTSAYAQELPYLKKEKDATTMMVDGKPFLMLAGELHNSTGSSVEYMEGLWKEMANLNLNTVLATVSWELMEPEEGKFDFKLVDAIIEGARKENLKIVFVWFGSWKNGNSTYAPRWVKKNPERFPRVKDESGRVLEVLSPFSESNLQADLKAYSALMRHIKEVDHDHTVIMMQCENEIGVFQSPRDYSKIAQDKWNAEVPQKFISYLSDHDESLYEHLQKVWQENGKRTKGNWEEVFGVSSKKGDFSYYTEELFMAYYYAQFINQVAEAGRRIHDLPVFCNVWLRYSKDQLPGSFPSGGPNVEVFDPWKAAGVSIDMLSPDIYVDQFDSVCNVYHRKDNPLFIPESGFGAVRAMHAIGEYDALGFSPFGIDGDAINGSSDMEVSLFVQAYATLANMDSLITANYGSDKMRGVYIDQTTPFQKIEFENYTFEIAPTSLRPQFDFVDDPRSRLTGQAFTAGGLIIQIGEDEFYVVGCGFKFEAKASSGVERAFTSVLSIDEGKFINNRFIPGRRRNGDSMTGLYPLMEKGELKSFKVELYQF